MAFNCVCASILIQYLYYRLKKLKKLKKAKEAKEGSSWGSSAGSRIVDSKKFLARYERTRPRRQLPKDYLPKGMGQWSMHNGWPAAG